MHESEAKMCVLLHTDESCINVLYDHSFRLLWVHLHYFRWKRKRLERDCGLGLISRIFTIFIHTHEKFSLSLSMKFAIFQRKLFERLGLLALHLVFLCFVVYLRPAEPEKLIYQRNHTSWVDWVCLLTCHSQSFESSPMPFFVRKWSKVGSVHA